MTFGNHSSMVDNKEEELNKTENVLENNSKVASRASPKKNEPELVEKPKVTPAKKPINPLLGGMMKVGGVNLQTYGNSNRRPNPLVGSKKKETPAKVESKQESNQTSPEKTKEENVATSKAALARGNARAPVNRKR